MNSIRTFMVYTVLTFYRFIVVYDKCKAARVGGKNFVYFKSFKRYCFIKRCNNDFTNFRFYILFPLSIISWNARGRFIRICILLVRYFIKLFNSWYSQLPSQNLLQNIMRLVIIVQVKNCITRA